MPMIRHSGVTPTIGRNVRIAPNATIVGDVQVQDGCAIGFNAVIVAESGPVRIGQETVIMDGAILRGTARDTLVVGNHCLIGPNASLVGCTLEDEVFVATGAAVFNAARLGVRSEIQVNGIVHLRTHVPADAVVPLGWVAVGNPAIIRSPSAHEEIWKVQESLDFPGYVFGAERPSSGSSFMPKVMSRYAEMLRRRHKDDAEIADHDFSSAS